MTLQAKFLGDNENGGIDDTVGAGNRWDDNCDVWHSGYDGWGCELNSNRRVRALAAWHEESGTCDRADLFADDQPWL